MGWTIFKEPKMKKILIKAGIVLTVFIVTIIVTSRIINTDSADMTTEMESATFPVVSIEYNGTEINRMFGYVSDMNLSYMRDSITPLMTGRKISFVVDTYGDYIKALKYEVRTVDMQRLIESTEIQEYKTVGNKIYASAVLKDLIDINKEYELVIKLTLKDDREIKYYTRVINPDQYHISDKLDYVRDFNSKLFDKSTVEDLKIYLESNRQANNNTFGHVDIHNSIEQVGWGELNPVRATKPVISIKELAPLTGSFALDYFVSTSVDGVIKFYAVHEYYRVRYTKDRMYLLDYDRTMDEVFEDNKSAYSDTSIYLGISGNDINITESESGDTIAFVANGRLYSYNVTENRVAYLFGFYDVFTDDIRKLNDSHDIKVMNIDEEGNIIFLVYGYMNQGDYEGQCGAFAYYYDANKNMIEELAYVPSTHSPDLLINEINRLSYMNSKGMLYLLSGSTLYGIHSDTRKVDIIAENLTEESFVISENNHLVAWQLGEDRKNCQELKLFNLETGDEKVINAKGQETIIPLAFIGEDLIYGVALKKDITKDRTGNDLIPMNKIKIENEKEGVLMQYQQDNYYIVGGEVSGNQIILHRLHLTENEVLEEALDDQIMTAQDAVFKKNNISYNNSEIYKEVAEITLKKKIKPESMKHLSPKMVITEENKTINLTYRMDEKRYVVYGKNGVDQIFSDPAKAVTKAYYISGIVMDEKGDYIYKKTTRQYKNQIMAIKQEKSGNEISELAVCLDVMIGYEGVVRNSQYMLDQHESVLDILKSSLENYNILDLSGCSLDMILYYVNIDIPVLSMLQGNKAVLIIGFNDTEIVVMDPSKEEIYKVELEQAVEWFEDNGNSFITYVPIDD